MFSWGKYYLVFDTTHFACFLSARYTLDNTTHQEPQKSAAPPLTSAFKFRKKHVTILLHLPTSYEDYEENAANVVYFGRQEIKDLTLPILIDAPLCLSVLSLKYVQFI